MIIQHIAHIYSLLDNVPEKDRPRDQDLAKFWQTVAFELHQMIYASKSAEKPSLVFEEVKKGRDDQYVWHFYASDLGRPVDYNKVNWHGQNTSQWCYAGAITLQDGKVSSHH